jgi:dipeptidyl aminopeptidase/acylaminoacyl peptidase
LSDINADIDEDKMAEMKPIEFQSRDGLKINGYLTLPKNSNGKNVPIVVIPHNGPLQRNTWGYNAEVQYLASRGYGILQVNYRGSSGYGQSFYAAGFKQWGAKIQDDIDDGVKYLIKSGIANPKKIAIYGTGLGGFIALNAAIRQPQLYKCAASNSGVLNLLSFIKSIPPFLKSNLQMYYEIIGNPVSEISYLRQASPVFHADRVNIPVFIAQNAKDPRVNPNDAIQFIKELKKRDAPYVYFDKQDAPFMPNREEARQKMYLALSDFLDKNLKK